MTSPSEESESPAYRRALVEGFGPANAPRALLKIGALALVTWVPLLALTVPTGLVIGHRVEVPLLKDPGFYGRYLFALPLLIFAEVIVGTSHAVQTEYFLESGLVRPEDLKRYGLVMALWARLRASKVVQGAIVLLSYVIVIGFRTVIAYRPGASSWERLGAHEGRVVTLAGWWCILVCLPLLVFLLLRWLWRACLWAWFLFQVSRLDLELTATHPDQAGGLGFLAWGQASFAAVVAAVSTVLSGSFAAEVLYGGETFGSLKFHLVVFVVLALAFLQAPLLAFSGRLARCRFQAMLDFGNMVWRHDHAFDEKWIARSQSKHEDLLGNPDVSSLANFALAFEHVRRMRIVPFDYQAAAVIVVSAIVPMLPFISTTIPLKDILQKLAMFLV